MSKIYGSYDDLFKDMEKELIKSLKDMAKIIRDEWTKLIELNFYNKFSPELYSRTFEILNSITVFNIEKNGDLYTIKIAYDEDKINYYPEENGLWNKHADYNGEFIMDYLVEYGWNHYYKGTHTQHEGSHAFEEMLVYTRSPRFINDFTNQIRKFNVIVK